MAANNTVLQTIVEEDKRGRVMTASTPWPSRAWPRSVACLPELSANRIGAPFTLAIGGACCVGGALWFIRKLPEIRKHIRPIYRQLGILPQIADGMQAKDLLFRFSRIERRHRKAAGVLTSHHDWSWNNIKSL